MLNSFASGIRTKYTQELPLYKKVLAITWPAFVELFLSSLFAAVDMIMVGRLGPTAISGVGLTNQPFSLLVSVFGAVNVGATTLVAWNIGAGNSSKASYITKQTIMINLFIGIILTVAGISSARYVMEFMGNDPDVIAYATGYMKILSGGIVFMAINMGITAALRGCGETRVPMIYNIVANFMNVVLNYALIYGNFGMPEMGVPGAALATTISRIIGMVLALCVLLFWKRSPIRILVKSGWKPDISVVKNIFGLGLPAAGEQFVIQSGLILFARMVSSLGVNAYAAHLIGVNINSMLFSVSQAFGVATSSLVGRSIGADDYSMAEKYTYATSKTARLINAVLGIMLFIFSRQIASIYTDVEEVLLNVIPVFIFMVLIHFFQSVQMSTAGALRGAGDTMYPLYACIFGIWIFRVSFCYVFVNIFHWGLVGAWLAFFLDQLTRSAIVRYRFSTGMWKQMKEKRKQKERGNYV